MIFFFKLTFFDQNNLSGSNSLDLDQALSGSKLFCKGYQQSTEVTTTGGGGVGGGVLEGKS